MRTVWFNAGYADQKAGETITRKPGDYSPYMWGQYMAGANQAVEGVGGWLKSL